MKEYLIYGDDILIERFPDKTRILYPPESLPSQVDTRATIENAVNNPSGKEPLRKLVDSNSRVTIAFDDPCLPLIPLIDDVRGIIIAVVLKELEKAGVKNENIRIICACGLHRHWNWKELATILGKRIVKEFAPQRLICHDAEDQRKLTFIGKTEKDEEVVINREVIESDLTIYVNLNWTTMNGGWKSIVVGLGAYQSIHHHHNPEVLLASSLMDPGSSKLHGSIARMGKLVEQKANVFIIETVLSISPPLPESLKAVLQPLSRRTENRPGLALGTMLKLSQLLPGGLKEWKRHRLKSHYQLIEVNAGQVDIVHQKTLSRLFRQQNIAATGQSDVMIVGIPNLSPYSTFSIFNPVLLMNLALGYIFNLYRGKPLVRKDGVLIIANPCRKRFHEIHHPSYLDFYEEVLPETKDPQEMADHYEGKFAKDPEYIDKYRYHLAYHGVHPLYAWYWGACALKHLRQVIVAGAQEPETARRLGFQPASSMSQAISMAEDILGRECTISYPFMPFPYAIDIM
jgi:hypothetical protein